jgi:hypothetical protein
MTRHILLDRKTTELVYEIMDEQGEMTKEELAELIDPLCNYDDNHLRQKELGRKINQIMRRRRDLKGVRTVFAVTSQDKYIDVEQDQAVADLTEVQISLKKQIAGLSASYQKVQNEKEKRLLIKQETLPVKSIKK